MENNAPESSDETQSAGLAIELPEHALHFLVRATPTRPLWQWLSHDADPRLLQDRTRGFQRTANILRQPTVRGRMVQRLQSDQPVLQNVLNVWAGANPALTEAIAAHEDDT